MKKEKLSRREKDNLRHRRQMLDAALALFSEKGFHNVSMHEIAKRSEFAIGTLYKFFKNKEDLYKALIMEKATEQHRNLMSILLKKDKDVLKIFKDYIAAKFEIHRGNASLFRLYLAETRGASFNIKAGLDNDIRNLHNDIVEKLISVIKKGIKEKVIRKMDPYYLAVTLEGLTNAFLVSWMENPEKHSYDENVPLITNLFLNGCLAK